MKKQQTQLKTFSAAKYLPPILSVIGNSGSGKTTLIEKLISELNRRGFKVGTIKHDVHGFEMDKPGKDSWRHKNAGAAMTVISSPYQIGVIKDVDHDHSLDELAMLFDNVDIILSEGYKRSNKPKLEVFRSEIHDQPLSKGDRNLLALISDAPLDLGVPRFGLNDVLAIIDFIIRYFKLGYSENDSVKEIA
jgi:molybdopterin-guanine dinucleotide biosynthesis protein B